MQIVYTNNGNITRRMGVIPQMYDYSTVRTMDGRMGVSNKRVPKRFPLKARRWMGCVPRRGSSLRSPKCPQGCQATRKGTARNQDYRGGWSVVYLV